MRQLRFSDLGIAERNPTQEIHRSQYAAVLIRGAHGPCTTVHGPCTIRSGCIRKYTDRVPRS